MLTRSSQSTFIEPGDASGRPASAAGAAGVAGGRAGVSRALIEPPHGATERSPEYARPDGAGFNTNEHVHRAAVASAAVTGATPGFREIGDRLRAARTARKLSLRGLADRLGVSPSLISQVETGLRQAVGEHAVRDGPRARRLARRAAVRGRSRRASAAPTASATRPADAVLGAGARTRPARARPQGRSASRRASSGSGSPPSRCRTSTSCYVTYEVGGASSPSASSSATAAASGATSSSGTLRITVGFEEYVLGPGDAITLDSTIPHRLVQRRPRAGARRLVRARPAALGRRRGLDAPSVD